MRKIILYIATSLDSFIARTDGSIDFLDALAPPSNTEDYGYNTLLGQIDSTLMGRKTYDSIMAMDMPFPYPDKKNYVFSRTQQQPSLDFVRWINDDVVNFVKNLKQQEGKDIWLIGGGTINTLLLNAQLIDEIQLALVPIFLGEGIPLFEKPLRESTFAINKVKHCHTGLIMLQLLPRQLST